MKKFSTENLVTVFSNVDYEGFNNLMFDLARGEKMFDEEGKETVVEEGYYHINGTPINFDLMNVNIIINAYGIQAATFEDVEEAYAAYNAQADATTDNALPADID